MNVAVYAPLKPPSHPVPSGDRLIGRLLIAALSRAGHEPELVSRLRSYDGRGDAHRQSRIEVVGRRLAERLARRLASRPRSDRPRCWLTYHLYHKAPDWLGPTVCEQLSIPYVVAEASDAAKQLGGPWDAGLRACRNALGRAAAVIALNPDDLDGVRPHLRPGALLEHIPAFIDAQPFATLVRDARARRAAGAVHGLDRDAVRIACVAMMRPGNKLDSYRLLAHALGALGDDAGNWQLVVAGDGTARPEVEAAFAPLADRVRLLGRIEPPALRRLLAGSDLFVWPGMREPLGLVYLEAQAAGLPVIGCAARGAPDLVAHGETGLLVPVGDSRALGAAIRELASDARRRARLGAAGRARVLARHDIAVAAPAIDALLGRIMERAA